MAEWNRAIDLANPTLLDKLRRRGFEIDQSDVIQRNLDLRNANAATFLQDDLLLRPDARRIEVLEEFLHNVQRRIGLTASYTPWQTEMHVKKFMLRHAKMLGLSATDIAWIESWLESAERS